MSTFTLEGFGRAANRVAAALDDVPYQRMRVVGEALRVNMLAAAKGSPVPVPKSQIKMKGPRKGKAEASAVVVGFGFATLAEFGSYHHPTGWEEPGPGAKSTRLSKPILAKLASGSALTQKQAGRVRNIRRALQRQAGFRVFLGDPSSGMHAVGPVTHTPFRPHPFQRAAIAATNVEAGRLYALATRQALEKGF